MIKLYGKPHLVWQYSWPRLKGLNKVLTPNGISFVSLDNWSREHLKAGRNKCQLTIDVSYTVCGGIHDFGSRSIVAMSLHINLSAVIMIIVFSFPCSNQHNAVAECCQCHLWDRAHLSFSPVLWNTRCHGISLGALSSANTLNKAGS